jgi:hypothetical protein
VAVRRLLASQGVPLTLPLRSRFIGKSPDDLLSSVQEYREVFANLLAVGAKLKQLEGQCRFDPLFDLPTADVIAGIACRRQPQSLPSREARGW